MGLLPQVNDKMTRTDHDRRCVYRSPILQMVFPLSVEVEMARFSYGMLKLISSKRNSQEIYMLLPSVPMAKHLLLEVEILQED